MKSLFLSGGGLHTLSFLGILGDLDPVDFDEVVAVSAGCILGLLFVLGWSRDEILTEILSDTVQNILRNQTDVFGVVSSASSLFPRKSLKALLQKWLKESGVDPATTFLEFRKRLGYELRFIVIDPDACLVSIDYRNHPFATVVDGVLASTSLPVLFPPYVIDGRRYFDAGFCDNSPIVNFCTYDTTAVVFSHHRVKSRFYDARCHFRTYQSVRRAYERKVFVIQVPHDDGTGLFYINRARVGSMMRAASSARVLKTQIGAVYGAACVVVALLHFF